MSNNLLAKFGLTSEDTEQFLAPGDRPKPKDGTYEYRIDVVKIQPGTTNKPKAEWAVIDFAIENGDVKDEYREWATLKDDKGSTDSAVARRGWGQFQSRLELYGQSLDAVDFEALKGRTGTLTLKTSKTGFQNITEISADEAKPSRRPAAKPSTKAAVLDEPGDEANEDDGLY